MLAELIKQRPAVDFVILLDAALTHQEFNFPNVRFVIVPRMKGLPHFIGKIIYDLFSFPAAIRKLDPDLFFAPYYDLWIPKTKRGVNIISVYDLCFWKMAKMYPLKSRLYHRLILSLNLKRKPVIMTISYSSQKDLMEEFKLQQKPQIIYCSYRPAWDGLIFSQDEIQAVRQKYGFKPDKRYFLYTAGLDYRKNVRGMLEAYAKFTLQEKNIDLIFTGPAKEDRNLNQTLAELGLQEKVVLTGKLSERELGIVYKEFASAVVNFSFFEGFGLSNLEALSTGLPLVCSDIPVFREVVGDKAIFCDPYKLESMVAGLFAVLGHKKSEAQFQPDERFNFKSNSQKFVDFISSYLG
ncbi:MAG: hypothetical protein A2X86_12305 [Bdellovibrionales bacterium GWA2_49_15]|nr:MAG: hypothetical protein A2X86_12305 [Bdellovibrionales bacterium GWA2_49_15]